MIIFRYKWLTVVPLVLVGCASEVADDQARSDVESLKLQIGELSDRLTAEEAKSKRLTDVMVARINRSLAKPVATEPAKPSSLQTMLDGMEKDKQERRLRTLEDESYLRMQGIKP